MSWEREEGWGGLGDGLRAGLVERLHTGVGRRKINNNNYKDKYNYDFASDLHVHVIIYMCIRREHAQ